MIKARWGQKLKVYAAREGARRVSAIFVRKRTVTSSEHGTLTLHTWKGLRVGDPKRKLRRLYPNSKPIKHSGHAHFRLRMGKYGSYLLAKVVNKRVVQLEVWPYEFC